MVKNSKRDSQIT